MRGLHHHQTRQRPLTPLDEGVDRDLVACSATKKIRQRRSRTTPETHGKSRSKTFLKGQPAGNIHVKHQARPGKKEGGVLPRPAWRRFSVGIRRHCEIVSPKKEHRVTRIGREDTRPAAAPHSKGGKTERQRLQNKASPCSTTEQWNLLRAIGA